MDAGNIPCNPMPESATSALGVGSCDSGPKGESAPLAALEADVELAFRNETWNDSGPVKLFVDKPGNRIGIRSGGDEFTVPLDAVVELLKRMPP